MVQIDRIPARKGVLVCRRQTKTEWGSKAAINRKTQTRSIYKAVFLLSSVWRLYTGFV